MPQAIRQAHERIIGERQVKNPDKMLSVYEKHAPVYVRGKAGAEVEFGNQLLLGEAESEVIVGLGTGGHQSAGGHEDVGPQHRADQADE